MIWPRRTSSSRRFEQVFAGRTGREDRLSQGAGSRSAEPIDWCIIDCPPSVGLLTFNALRACDEVIVPVETGYFSLHGLAKMMETLELLKERCNKEILIRVLPTLYDTRTKLAREVLSRTAGQVPRLPDGEHRQLQHQAERGRQLRPADHRIRSGQPRATRISSISPAS